MDRRDFLARTGALAAAALAGCLTDPPGAGTPIGGETPTDTPTPTETDGSAGTDEPTETDTPAPTDDPTETPIAADASFEIQGITPGGGANSASVSFDDGVTVDGTIGGNNGCYTARLKSADRSGDTLTVVVEAYEDSDTREACTQSLVDIDYVASFTFDESPPERVVVEHASGGETETVAEETR